MATMLVSVSADEGSDLELTNIYIRKGSNGNFKLNFDTDDSECNGVEIVLTPVECGRLAALLGTVAKPEATPVTDIETKVR